LIRLAWTGTASTAPVDRKRTAYGRRTEMTVGGRTYVRYGDASRLDLLGAAGAARARLFIVAVDNQAETNKIAEQVHKHFPNLTILARCFDRTHYQELRRVGITRLYRETLGSAFQTGIDALVELGYRRYTAHRRNDSLSQAASRSV
jgi:voltage-gated potassium channel Kch